MAGPSHRDLPLIHAKPSMPRIFFASKQRQMYKNSKGVHYCVWNSSNSSDSCYSAQRLASLQFCEFFQFFLFLLFCQVFCSPILVASGLSCNSSNSSYSCHSALTPCHTLHGPGILWILPILLILAILPTTFPHI